MERGTDKEGDGGPRRKREVQGDKKVGREKQGPMGEEVVGLYRLNIGDQFRQVLRYCVMFYIEFFLFCMFQSYRGRPGITLAESLGNCWKITSLYYGAQFLFAVPLYLDMRVFYV